MPDIGFTATGAGPQAGPFITGYERADPHR